MVFYGLFCFCMSNLSDILRSSGMPEEDIEIELGSDHLLIKSRELTKLVKMHATVAQFQRDWNDLTLMGDNQPKVIEFYRPGA